MHNFYKKIGLIFIKYGPFLVALTCAIKIWLFYLGLTGIAKCVNVVITFLITLCIYSLGRYLSYCYIHRVLCNFTLYGAFYYIIYLIFDIPYNNIYTLVHLILYTIVLIIFCICYKCKKKKNK